MFQDLTTLVIDVGTHATRIGYGGDEAPKVDVPSYVSYSACMEENQKQIKAGNKYLGLDKSDLQIESIFKPTPEGSQALINPNNYCPFIEYLLTEELHVNLRDYSLLFSEDLHQSPTDLLAQRETITQFAFEKLGVANVYFLKTPVLSCFATGRSTAVVVDSGHSLTRVAAVHDGFILGKSVKTVPTAGMSMSSVVQKLGEEKLNSSLKSRFHLSENSYNASFLNYHLNSIVNDIKESFSQGSSEEGGESAERISYELPDKQMIQIDKSELPDLFVSPQAPWAKDFGNLEYRGIPNMIAETVNNSDVDVKKQFYSNILLTGGNMLFGGNSLCNNVLSKLTSLAPPNTRVKPVNICANSERKYLSWIGGSIVTSLTAFQSYWIGKEEYQSIGSAILQKKCT